MSSKQFDMHDASSTQTADILGITRRRISQLRSAGILKNNGKRGRYDVPQAIRDYAAYLADNGGGDAQTRLINQRVRKLRIENDKAEAKLIGMEDAYGICLAVVEAYVAAMADMPEKLAPTLAKKQSAHAIRRTLEKDVDERRQRICDEFRAFFRKNGLELDENFNPVELRKAG